MKLTCQAISLVLLLILSANFLQAQNQVVDAKKIRDLIGLGYDEETIIAYLEAGEKAVEVDKIEIRLMEKRKTAPKLTAWLKKHAKPAKKRLDFQGVLDYWSKNQEEAALIRMIKSDHLYIDLTVPQSMQLMNVGVPGKVIQTLRRVDPKSKKIGGSQNKLTLEDIVLMVSSGKSDRMIIEAIAKSDQTFELPLKKIRELRTDGVSDLIIGELYKRRKVKVEPVTPKIEDVVKKPLTQASSESLELKIFREPGMGISMLKPVDFVATQEFLGGKGLIQMVAPQDEDSTRDLPDLELSVMVVHPRKKSPNPIIEPNLKPVALQFVKGLKSQFARDGITVATEKETPAYIAAHRALRIATQAQVKKTSSGYQGACYLLYDGGRIFVISYSMLLEKAHRWRPVLENCVRSLVFERKKNVIALDGASPREQILQLFKNWRSSIRQLDYAAYRQMHSGFSDTVASRVAFLTLARGTNDDGKRVEVNGIDLENNEINYNVFSVEGMNPFKLQFAQRGESWALRQLNRR